MKHFEDLTIAELRKLNEQFKNHNPEFKTAEELLDEMNNTEDFDAFDYEHN